MHVTDAEVRQYEGLVISTARLVVASGVELDIEDVRQMLRIRVWRALAAYDSSKDRVGIKRWVFGAIVNAKVDLLRRPRRHERSLDQFRDSNDQTLSGDNHVDRFDARYLNASEDQVYGHVGDDLELPSWLNTTERRIVKLLMHGMSSFELDEELGLRHDVTLAYLRTIRVKLADWRPTPTGRSAPLPTPLTRLAEADRPSAPRRHSLPA